MSDGMFGTAKRAVGKALHKTAARLSDCCDTTDATTEDPQPDSSVSTEENGPGKQPNREARLYGGMTAFVAGFSVVGVVLFGAAEVQAVATSVLAFGVIVTLPALLRRLRPDADSLVEK